MSGEASTREKILEAAYRLFLEKGYSDVSLSELVSAAGITKGGFYHHFASKDELFAEVVDSYLLPHYRRLTEEISRTGGGAREKLEALCGRVCSLPARVLEEKEEELGFGYYVLIFQGVRHYPRFVEKLAGVYRSMREAVEGILREGKKNGEIKPGVDCSAAAFQIISQAEGALLMWTLDKSLDLAGQSRKALDTIWGSISTAKE
jgi:AcrR family transcriptional regulator